MFQWTNTIVLNSLIDAESGKDKLQKGTDSLHILRVNNFKKNCVKAIYKRVAKKAKPGSVEVPVKPAEGKLHRIKLYARLSGSNNSYYANDFVFKGKPFVYEFDGASTAAEIVAAIKSINSLYGDKFLKVQEGAQGGVEFIGDNYTLFTEALLEEFNPEDKSITGGVWTKIEEGTIVPCENGFGTHDQIMKDLRLPTAENTSWTSINAEEQPVEGALYDQYVIEYEVNRGNMGGAAVGQQVTSKTNHVFFVNQAIVSEFEEALDAIGGVTEAQEKPEGYVESTEGQSADSITD